MKLADKVVVVTGGGGGLGRALVLDLLGRGARVAAADINPAALEETAGLAGGRREALATFTLNVADKAAVKAFPAQVLARFGVVDGVINNAGIIQPFVRLKDLEDAVIERVLDVNLFGTLGMTRAFLPHLLARPVAHLTNISSMGGFLPVPGQTIYGASKAAVKLMTEGLGAELAETNVKVTVVFPGGMNTNITANSGAGGGMRAMTPEQMKKAAARLVTPAKAAQLILDGMERDRARILVGKDAQLLDKLYRLNPGRAVSFIAGQMKSLLNP